MTLSLVKVGDLCEQIRGVTYSKGDAVDTPHPGYLPVLRANNITDCGLTYEDLVFVPAAKVRDRQMIRENDIVIAASSGSLDVVGKAARALKDFDGGFGAFCKVLRPNGKVDPSFFAHFFQTQAYRRRVSSLAAGANINNLRNEHLDDLEISLPPLLEQRRVAAILDKADALRAKRREAIAKLDQIIQSVFVNIFGDPVTNPKGWPSDILLGDVADICSGVTKGRKTTGPTRSVPYLAVANVQDRRLRLDVVKQIEVTDAEIQRYHLELNDLLLTEGGDPDKLGRGALWDASISECIHQNHVFRVRLTNPIVHPVFLNWLVGSQRGKRYFLGAAKQTTGIASINMTQLRKFPLLVPPKTVQHRFAEIAATIEYQQRRASASASGLQALVEALQAQAFSGAQ